jgi:hypothetical protein
MMDIYQSYLDTRGPAVASQKLRDQQGVLLMGYASHTTLVSDLKLSWPLLHVQGLEWSQIATC